jgi:hypothetical protein
MPGASLADIWERRSMAMIFPLPTFDPAYDTGSA